MFREPKHERDLLDVARICELEANQPIYDVRQTIEKALKELEGKEFTSARVSEAKIVRSKTRSGWKIAVKRGKQIEPEKMRSKVAEDAYLKALGEIKNLSPERCFELKNKAMKNIKSNNPKGRECDYVASCQNGLSKFALNDLSIKIEMVEIYKEMEQKTDEKKRKIL